jgi:hypothetical protein
MPKAWTLGRTFSVDEQTIGFQGNHINKKCITYKAEGDAFQNDALCKMDGPIRYTFETNLLQLTLDPRLKSQTNLKSGRDIKNQVNKFER